MGNIDDATKIIEGQNRKTSVMDDGYIGKEVITVSFDEEDSIVSLDEEFQKMQAKKKWHKRLKLMAIIVAAVCLVGVIAMVCAKFLGSDTGKKDLSVTLVPKETSAPKATKTPKPTVKSTVKPTRKPTVKPTKKTVVTKKPTKKPVVTEKTVVTKAPVVTKKPIVTKAPAKKKKKKNVFIEDKNSSVFIEE